jgi:hypothetical protein
VTVQPVWPASVSELVLWAQLISVWVIATYAVVLDRTRPPAPGSAGAPSPAEWVALSIATGLAAVAAALFPPAGTSVQARLALLVLLAGLVMGTAVMRWRLRPSHRSGHRYLAEFEIGVNLAAVLGSGAVIGLAQIGASPREPLARGGKAAAVLCVLAAVAFVFRGGTTIVRAVLDRMSAVPRVTARSTELSAPQPASPGPASERRIDVVELNRGRSIGNLERLMMVMVIGLGSYESLGFLIAAKGLIRAREFEDRDFAEYFILGSLTSAAVAMVIGMTLRVALPFLWSA